MQEDLRHEAKLESARMARGVDFGGRELDEEREARSEYQAFAKPRSGRREVETAGVETKRPERAALSEVDGRKRSRRKEKDEGGGRGPKSKSRHKTKKEPDAESNNIDRRSQDQRDKRRATTRTRDSQARASGQKLDFSIFSKAPSGSLDADKAKLLMAKYLRK